jgi:hypothetical protein
MSSSCISIFNPARSIPRPLPLGERVRNGLDKVFFLDYMINESYIHGGIYGRKGFGIEG